MTEVPAGCCAKKSARRTLIVDGIMQGLASPTVFNVIGDGGTEAKITNYLHQTLVAALRKVHERLDPVARQELLDKRARASLLWEGDVKTTVNHILFLGVQHRPDFVVLMDGIRIALEVKRGDSGAAVREALGQCLVYASQFEFACCVLVDTSRDKKLKRAYEIGVPERYIIDRLWQDFNVRLAVV